jgi:hypothetical protein
MPRLLCIQSWRWIRRRSKRRGINRWILRKSDGRRDQGGADSRSTRCPAVAAAALTAELPKFRGIRRDGKLRQTWRTRPGSTPASRSRQDSSTSRRRGTGRPVSAQVRSLSLPALEVRVQVRRNRRGRGLRHSCRWTHLLHRSQRDVSRQ